MRGRNIIRISILTVIAAGSLLLLRSEAPATKDKSCKESMEECCKKKESGGDKTIWESLPQQFFSSI
ncbi:MAG TPA: hypothetical protein VI461_10535 [Chitinophagaceae bacterium]|nr:hypothetical protein [Chitinophagaceae bacterium]